MAFTGKSNETMGKLPNSFALLIGIVYEDGLNTIGDAEDIASILKDESICGYPPENVILVTGDKADRKGILNAFKELKEKTGEHSSVFIYYSGHGGVFEETFHFVPYGMKDGMTEEEYKAAWVTADEIKDQINALLTKRLIFFLDCCHATGIAKSGIHIGQNAIAVHEGASEPSKIQNFKKTEGLAQKIDNEKGISIVASCKEEQESYQLGDDKNSLFTKHLLIALHAKHQTQFADPYVRIFDVAGYLLRVIPPIIEEAAASSDPPLDIRQEPYANLEVYDNFILSQVPAEIRKQFALQDPGDLQPTPKAQKENMIAFRETTGANNLLLFIHGFSGEAGDTFGRIPDMLIQDPRMDGWDMKPFGYSSFVTPDMGKDVWAGIGDVKRISDYLCTSVKYKFDKYDRIAIVAHGLGGLIAQRAILDFKKEYRDKISHVMLLGTPSNGIEPARLAGLWNDKYQEMSSEGNFITSLRREWTNYFGDKLPFKLRVVASTEDEYVTIDSCYTPFPSEYCVTIQGKHLSMVKPRDENDDCYRLILHTLTNTEFAGAYTNNEEINIALGKYDAVVKELLPIKDALDQNGLKRLIFGLEGLDRREEALQILSEHPKAQDDTDLMGIIGGRYKRAYLKTPTADAGEAATVYYELALEKSNTSKNYEQIYYHAINLAFLGIVVENDKEKMGNYAQQALEAASACPDDLWKFATIAEANMYLGDREKAEAFYLKASEMAGIREKISIHLNAYAGYTALTQTNNPQDDFILFLKVKFLS